MIFLKAKGKWKDARKIKPANSNNTIYAVTLEMADGSNRDISDEIWKYVNNNWEVYIDGIWQCANNPNWIVVAYVQIERLEMYQG